VSDSKKDSNGSDIGNVIAARASLLDFYGDRATSFVSLFLASIFGLVTVSAITQAMLFSMVGQETIIPQLVYFRISLNAVFIILSAVLFIVFVVVALYTYNRYVLYADLSENLTHFEMSVYADLVTLPARIGKEGCNEEILKKMTEKCASTLEDKDKWKAKIGDDGVDFKTNFFVYQNYRTEIQKQNPIKKILGSKHFKLLTYLLFLGLALLTYYPLFTLPFKVA
jgi:hypothetical protein